MKTGLIVRDAADWVKNHLRDLQVDLMRVDASNIHHIETCPGCPTCDFLMQFYSGCEVCGRTAHKEALVYHPADGTYTCPDCSCHGQRVDGSEAAPPAVGCRGAQSQPKSHHPQPCPRPVGNPAWLPPGGANEPGQNNLHQEGDRADRNLNLSPLQAGGSDVLRAQAACAHTALRPGFRIIRV